MRRGILGGTFDPIHIGHLFVAEAAYRSLGLDVVTFLPAGRPWQKADRRVSAAVHRLAMTRLAVEGIEYFTVDASEVGRDGPTYTIDTVAEMGNDAVTLILGADSAAGIRSWHRAAELLELVDLAVVPRPGTGFDEVRDISDRLTWIDVPPLNVSARDLRAMRRAGGSIRFLVPDPVWAYVEEHDLYG